MSFASAQKLIGRCARSTARLASREFGGVLEELGRKGHRLVGCGLLRASGRPLPDLRGILASHALIHAAEGEFFRDALALAAERSNVPVSSVREREVFPKAAAVLRISEDDLRHRVSEMGKPLGAPWTQDEKLAALVAWMCLAQPGRGRATARPKSR
jgi:hypothetical protein